LQETKRNKEDETSLEELFLLFVKEEPMDAE